ncbi:hypothetical protein [Microbacterium sp. 77mftsu3.1]|uniref:hypothetical protein n=1 Tax=Microbacterium sp. 77mftsu3.1 TaxID=1761802 RepID=UPI000361A41F|nr:hypothetical protein [Microbacterium sp. 77mftsu3.1]SDH33431.1 hypothetical protein SAMN04488590_3056 [Microbacterium sp. 77mftsu3.1]
MTWTEDDHPRAASGTFTDKPQSDPEMSLTLPVHFLRTATGVHRVRAGSEEDAAREHTALTGEHAEPIYLAETIAYSKHGRVAVDYSFLDEGEDGEYDPTDEEDTPYARIRIEVDPEREGGEPESFSFCTRVPAYADPTRFVERADRIAWDLHTKSRYGADAAELAREHVRLAEGATDPLITPPQTAAEAAQMYCERGEGDVVIGHYIVNTRTTDRDAQPYPSMRMAELHLPAGYDSYRVQAGPVFLPNGKVAVAPTAA